MPWVAGNAIVFHSHFTTDLHCCPVAETTVKSSSSLSCKKRFIACQVPLREALQFVVAMIHCPSGPIMWCALQCCFCNSSASILSERPTTLPYKGRDCPEGGGLHASKCFTTAFLSSEFYRYILILFLFRCKVFLWHILKCVGKNVNILVHLFWERAYLFLYNYQFVSIVFTGPL